MKRRCSGSLDHQSSSKRVRLEEEDFVQEELLNGFDKHKLLYTDCVVRYTRTIERTGWVHFLGWAALIEKMIYHLSCRILAGKKKKLPELINEQDLLVVRKENKLMSRALIGMVVDFEAKIHTYHEVPRIFTREFMTK